MSLFSARKPESQLTRTEALSCIPKHIPSVTSIETHGRTRLEYPLSMRPFFLQLARKFTRQTGTPLTKKIELDEYGTMVWRLIDGYRTISQIIELFATEAGLSKQDAEISVTAFMRELGRRGLIALKPATASGG